MRAVLVALFALLAAPTVAAAQEHATVEVIHRFWNDRWVYYDAAAATDNTIDAYVLEAAIVPDHPVHVAIVPKVALGGATPEQFLELLSNDGTVVLAVDDDLYGRSNDVDVGPMIAESLERSPGDTQAALRGVLLRLATTPEASRSGWWSWIAVPALVAGVAAGAFALGRRQRVA